MSQSEVHRFAEYLKANPEPLPEIGKDRLTHAVKFAAERGFKFSADDAKAYIKSRARAAGRELSEEQLNKVAGGSSSCMESIHCCL
jgi:hypothetical protein